MIITRKLVLLCSIGVLALSAACSSNPPRETSIGSAPGGVVNNGRQFGNVSGIDVVPAAARPSGGGALLGAVIGGVVGNQIGSGTGRAVATGAGVVGGAVVGNSIETRNRNEGDTYRVSVRLDDGSFARFDYQNINDLRVGDRVKVEAGLLYRV